jgi:toluene monooxygenase electron transfer component
MPNVEIPAAGITFHCADDDTILRAALRAGLGLPYGCNVGACGSCRFVLLDGEVRHDEENLPGLSARDRDSGRWLGCRAHAIGDVKIKVPQRDAFKSKFLPARIVGTFIGTEDITHDIREFRFRLERPVPFQAGQFALIENPQGGETRAYSMANVSDTGQEWHFAIRHVPGGSMTRYLFGAMQPGDHVNLDGPYGLAYLREDAPRDILCLAGGSGLGPMISIARAAAESESLKDRTVHFVYGGRSARDICGENILRRLPGFGTRIHYHCSVSDPSPDWTGRAGFVHEIAGEIFSEQLRNFEIYFAGPPAMADAVMKMTVTNKVPLAQLHFDRFY